MFDDILRDIRQKVSSYQYVMTTHAEEEMADDGLSIYDVEQGILTGEILERQRDRNTYESKFRIRGTGLDNQDLEVVVKLGRTGKVVMITVYVL
ncbi:DUF4258 domain-containing protein [Roseofilum sp. BLCC_M91]|uniref:DUF4258 domain-containing protein n=1 Tax=Roseofilum halophilum BLCC-M91 TaxID=3022259 RepID=A0ABT7BQT9_9CYAN|nr:DUF4258 domain-containing protein [Roseofilum halophilum]MDJ1181554.1 DUF4258 domain-containing protein [Roseofilum halophilum BLCC-M91]